MYPEQFKLPKGVYEVKLAKPCGILFEEIEPNRGVYIQDLVEGGNAERQGILKPDDILIGVTAIQIAGAKWERRLIPARKFGFDLVVGAIGSNEEKWGCNNVILMVERPGECNRKVRVSIVLPRTYVMFDMSLGDLATHLTFICLYLIALGSYMY